MAKNHEAMLDHLFVPRKLSLDCVDYQAAETALIESLTKFLSENNVWLSSVVEIMSSYDQTPPTVEQLSSIFKQAESNTFFLALPLLEHNAVILFNATHPQQPGTPAD